MSSIIPAILPKSFDELIEKLERVRRYVDAVQIDICDGNFVDATTWPYTRDGPSLRELFEEREMLPYVDEIKYGIDLMIARPEEIIEDFVNLGVNRIIIHVESTDHMDKIIDGIKRKYGYDKSFAPDLISLGMAVSVNTPFEKYGEYISKVDFVQLMGIARIGHQGQAFDEKVLAKIREIRRNYPDQKIQVDGGVSLDNLGLLLSAGADTFAVGSALFKTRDIGDTIKEFNKIIEGYGS